MATIEKREDANGNVRYRARVRIRGAKSRSRTFKRLTDARTWAAKAGSDLGHGVYVATGADRRRTLAELIDKFEKEQLPVRANNADKKKMSAQLKWWKDNAGYLTLDKLTPAEVGAQRATILARRTGRAAPTAAPKQREVSVIASDREPLPGGPFCGLQVGMERAPLASEQSRPVRNEGRGAYRHRALP